MFINTLWEYNYPKFGLRSFFVFLGYLGRFRNYRAERITYEGPGRIWDHRFNLLLRHEGGMRDTKLEGPYISSHSMSIRGVRSSMFRTRT